MSAATQAFLDAAISIAVSTRPDRVAQLAKKIRDANPKSATTQSLGGGTGAKSSQLVSELIEAWRESGISGDEAAGILQGTSGMYAHSAATQSVELVWTGPSSEMVPTRKTEQALLQVIRGAEKKLFLTSFVAYEVATVLNALREATDRGISVSILVESSKKHGGYVKRDSIGKVRKLLPDARVLYWARKDEAFLGGKVHAKVAVADGRECFLTSANLTGHAMEKNMEAGVLISGGAIPRNLHDHLDGLVTTELIS
jgi:phosphatidylserine/phosphatidylglycerophosphate/cardiolipin synthase-like enzyme